MLKYFHSNSFILYTTLLFNSPLHQLSLAFLLLPIFHAIVANDFLDYCMIQYNGGPELAKDDYCMDCLIEGARTVVSADSYRDRRTLMKDVANDVLAGKCQDGRYYVSRTWYDCKSFATL